VTLISITGLLAAAAFGTRYRSIRRAGTAGCTGVTMLDTAMVLTTVTAIPSAAWPVILAVAASATRLTFTVRTLRPVIKG